MKIAIVLNDDFTMWQFRRGLISALCASGAEVWTITPPGPYVPKLEALGARHHAVEVRRFASPLADARLMLKLYRPFVSERFDIVHTITVKPNVFGGLAARLARVPRTSASVSGAGYGFSSDCGWLVARAVPLLYGLAFRSVYRVWFQNEDDLSLFVSRGLLAPEKGLLIRSEGVNLDEYNPHPLSPELARSLRAELGVGEKELIVLMAARVVWSKGVREFVEASEQVALKFPKVRFLLAGPLDPESPDPIPESYLLQKKSGQFRWLGFRSDLKNLLGLADVVVHPSYYREGVPTVLLEAMAMGKPILTTDNVGCRETVEPGQNGFLVPSRNSGALATAIETLLGDDQLRLRFGLRSLEKVRAEFDEHNVISRVMSELYGFGTAGRLGAG